MACWHPEDASHSSGGEDERGGVRRGGASTGAEGFVQLRGLGREKRCSPLEPSFDCHCSMEKSPL